MFTPYFLINNINNNSKKFLNILEDEYLMRCFNEKIIKEDIKKDYCNSLKELIYKYDKLLKK